LPRTVLAPFVAAILLSAASGAAADEAGVSFWLPGQFGSLAATQADPGWSLPAFFYYSSADTEADEEFPRGGRIAAGADVSAGLLFFAPTYTFPTPLLGAQAAVSLGGAVGRSKVNIAATLTGPGGGTLSGSEHDSLTGGSDLYPMLTLRWNFGNHNVMAYTLWGVPVGAYEPDRLANLGTNHWSADAGGGYTYLNRERKQEFSATLGLTYNFENPSTNYQNGIDAHLDFAASHFATPTCHVGVVGYVYQQLSGDSGAGATLGDFKSQVMGFGPQVGWFIGAGEVKWYLNLKGYYEYNARNRPEGWNLWLTVALPLT
jgi:hypothetical protein